MNTQKIVRIAALTFVVLLLVSGAAYAANQLGAPQAAKTLHLEIAENHRYVRDETPAFDDGSEAFGTEFVVEAYLYPAGTVTCIDGECNGVLEDGSPEFPDKVVGFWICRGWFIGDGAHTTSGPIVATTQIFSLSEVHGEKTIITDGFEYIDYNFIHYRAIVGGTGEYRKASGEQASEFIGWNPALGATFVVELKLSGR